MNSNSPTTSPSSNIQVQVDDIQTTVNSFAELRDKINKFLDVYYRTNLIDQTLFNNIVYFYAGFQMMDKNNPAKISLGTTNGTTIGKSATEKLAFYGDTPIVQQGAITAPTGGSTVDSQSRTAINAIITALANLGLIA